MSMYMCAILDFGYKLTKMSGQPTQTYEDIEAQITQNRQERAERPYNEDIQKENETYYSLLREALPAGQAREDAFNPVPSSAQAGTAPDQERISVQAGGPDPPLPDKSASSRSPDKQVSLHFIVNIMVLSQN